ncbi:MAG: hypothetical protein ACWGOL_11835, partial [Desulfuromonadales bacterium]
MKLHVKLLFLVLLCWPSLVCAELPEQVQNDFSVIDGVVVMPINGEYIVDMNDQDNLSIGDIL